MDQGDGEFHTETFTNARGWAAVRVTHLPTSLVAERSRSDVLRSAVQAQSECMQELRRALAGDEDEPGPRTESVSRAEFDALAARVARLEQEIGGDAYPSS